MFNKLLFSAAALMIIDIAPSSACEAMSEKPIIKFEDCFKKSANNFQQRLNNFDEKNKGNTNKKLESERQDFIKHLGELSKHEKERCMKTCHDAPVN